MSRNAARVSRRAAVKAARPSSRNASGSFDQRDQGAVEIWQFGLNFAQKPGDSRLEALTFQISKVPHLLDGRRYTVLSANRVARRSNRQKRSSRSISWPPCGARGLRSSRRFICHRVVA